MTEASKRAYNSPERTERAHATANAILRAAADLLERDGYAAVTMKDVARAAGVAPATVYLHYPSKSAIVAALMAEITAAPALSVEHVETAPTAEQVVIRAAAILRDLNERAWLVADILRAHGGADRELREMAGEWRRRHFEASTRGVAAAATAGHLRPELSAPDASDLMYAVGGTDVYRALVRERGWSGHDYESWLVTFMQQLLLRPTK